MSSTQAPQKPPVHPLAGKYDIDGTLFVPNGDMKKDGTPDGTTYTFKCARLEKDKNCPPTLTANGFQGALLRIAINKEAYAEVHEACAKPELDDE